jgi:hypothetical protein
MLVEESFIFLAIPRCASVSVETSFIQQGFKLKYHPNILSERRSDLGLVPVYHGHQSISYLKKNIALPTNFNDPSKITETVSIYREPVERFLSAWKYVLQSIKMVDDSSYGILKNMGNEEFVQRFSPIITSPFDLVKSSTFDKLLGPILGYEPITNSKFNNSRQVFSSVLTSPARWHENDVTIRFFHINNLVEFENYVQQKTGKEFKILKINDTADIETNMVVDDILKEFYFKKIEPTQKIDKTLI